MSVFRSKVYIQYLRSLFWFLLTILSASLPNAAFIRNLSIPSKHFNIFSTLFLSWYDFATPYNIKSTLKQRCVRQLWDLQGWTTSNQFCLFCLFWFEQRQATTKQRHFQRRFTQRWATSNQRCKYDH